MKIKFEIKKEIEVDFYGQHCNSQSGFCQYLFVSHITTQAQCLLFTNTLHYEPANYIKRCEKCIRYFDTELMTINIEKEKDVLFTEMSKIEIKKST